MSAADGPMDRLAPHALRPLARPAGALYLVIIVCGIYAEVAVRSQVLVAGDAPATAANLAAAEVLVRTAFVADTLMAAADVGLAVLLYRLLRPVEPTLSLAAAAFRLIQTAVIAANLLNQQAAVSILQEAATAALPVETREALALRALELQGHGYDLGLIFFGVSSLLTGWLVVRSRFLPAFLGVLLMAAGAVYVTGSYILFLVPALSEPFQVAYLIPLVAETAFCLWLLLRGVDAAIWKAMVRAAD